MFEECIDDTNNRKSSSNFLEIAIFFFFLMIIHLICQNITKLSLEAFLILPEHGLNTFACCKTRYDSKASFFLDKINGLKIIWIEHGHLQICARFLKGDNIGLLRNWFWHNRKNIKRNSFFREINKRNTQNIGVHLLQLTFLN